MCLCYSIPPHVPSEWKDTLLVPVPKKGDLSCCDDWRGISLLDVTDKLFARVLNDWLQLVVKETVSDSHRGFRTGRGCVDMIFRVRQLVEKASEHNAKVFLLFVDLCKAYDSVSRAACPLVCSAKVWCYGWTYTFSTWGNVCYSNSLRWKVKAIFSSEWTTSGVYHCSYFVYHIL